ncbi:MAG: hypothetical protein PF693_09960 [Spirochaetia bacterium]|jgi:nitrogen fixation-related uncharacterized protein|nr:hypothetical protein [Spirochaetia bacterium]
MIYLPKNTHEAVITITFIVLGIILFLWGVAVGRNEDCEAYKIQNTESEILKLRLDKIKLTEDKKILLEKNKLYMNTLSGLRHLLRKEPIDS